MEYEFTLRYQLPVPCPATDELLEQLGAGGCDDATIGIGTPGRLAMMFCRAAPDAHSAMHSALVDVARVIPGARLIEAAPDLVGITEVADIVGVSRQHMRTLMVGSRPDAPAPVHEGNPSLWHLADVLRYLAGSLSGERKPALGSFIEIAEVAQTVNVARARQQANPEQLERYSGLLGIG